MFKHYCNGRWDRCRSNDVNREIEVQWGLSLHLVWPLGSSNVEHHIPARTRIIVWRLVPNCFARLATGVPSLRSRRTSSCCDFVTGNAFCNDSTLVHGKASCLDLTKLVGHRLIGCADASVCESPGHVALSCVRNGCPNDAPCPKMRLAYFRTWSRAYVRKGTVSYNAIRPIQARGKNDQSTESLRFT